MTRWKMCWATLHGKHPRGPPAMVSWGHLGRPRVQSPFFAAGLGRALPHLPDGNAVHHPQHTPGCLRRRGHGGLRWVWWCLDPNRALLERGGVQPSKSVLALKPRSASFDQNFEDTGQVA